MASDQHGILSVKIVGNIKTVNAEKKPKVTFSTLLSVLALIISLVTVAVSYLQVHEAKDANTVAQLTQLSSLVGEIASEPLSLAQTASANANNPANLHAADVAITLGSLVQAQEAYSIMQSLNFEKVSATESYEVAEGYYFGGNGTEANMLFSRALGESPDTRTHGDILIGLAVSNYNMGGPADDAKAEKYMREARNLYRNAGISQNRKNEVYVDLADIPFEAQLSRPNCGTVQNELNEVLGIIPSQNSAQLEDEDEDALLQPAVTATRAFCPRVPVPDRVRIAGVEVQLTDSRI
jgi:hypothetical protein